MDKATKKRDAALQTAMAELQAKSAQNELQRKSALAELEERRVQKLEEVKKLFDAQTIKAGDPAGFFATIAREGDQRKICGLSPMYTQLELLRDRPARLLMHDIAMEPQTESAVSFASIAIE